MLETIDRPAFTWAASRVTGSAHETSGEACQDALTLRAGRCGNVPYITAAVADGAGSAMFAEEASRLATRMFTGFIASEISGWGLDGLDDLALDAVYGVHCKLRRLASERGVHADHVASTLLGLVATAERTVLVQIGDGGIVMGSPSGPPWRLAFTPQHGEYRNEARFISDSDAMDHLQQSSFDGPTGTLVMFTDGLEDLLLDPFTYVVHTPLFDRLGAELAEHHERGLHKRLSADLMDLMASGSVRSRTNDDTTLLAIRFDGGLK
jgi:hypothetical protein